MAAARELPPRLRSARADRRQRYRSSASPRLAQAAVGAVTVQAQLHAAVVAAGAAELFALQPWEILPLVEQSSLKGEVAEAESPAVQVAVVGENGGGPLTDSALRLRPPGAVVVSADPDAPGLPLLADRPLVDGRAAAYVCRGMVCDLPRTRPDELAAALRSG